MSDKEEDTVKKKIRGYTVNMPRRKVLAVDWETGEITSEIVDETDEQKTDTSSR